MPAGSDSAGIGVPTPEGTMDFDPVEWVLNPPVSTPAELAAARADVDAIRAARASAQPKPCPKCNGEGRLDQFRHVARGCCFACGGSGTLR